MNYKEIAKLANVGVGTISRYFNNGSISQKNKDKITKIIKENNFKPSFRVILRNRMDKIIYVLVTSLNEAFVNDIIEGLKSIVGDSYQLLIIKTSLESKEYLKDLKHLMKHKPEKLLLFLPQMNEKISNYIQDLQNISLVVYGKQMQNIFSVYVNEIESMEELVKKYITKYKPKKIAFIGKDTRDITTGKQRLEAFQKIASKYNIKSKAFLVEKNHPQIIKEAFASLQKQGFKDIICGTHTIFTTCSLLNNDSNVKLTDIGYFNFLDSEKKYILKIFIDFFLIGVIIGNIFIGKNKKIDNKIKTKII